jgi:hypothetical protein
LITIIDTYLLKFQLTNTYIIVKYPNWC